MHSLDTFDFVIRVPQSELRASELSDMEVNVVSLRANRGNALSDVPLQHHLALDVIPVASLTSIADPLVPISMQRIIESS